MQSWFFDDPHARSQQERETEGEERWQTVGVIRGSMTVLVAHTYCEVAGEEVIRIMSARKATPSERRAYEEASGRLAKEIDDLKKMKDEEIDLSDIPEITDWSGAVVGKFYRPARPKSGKNGGPASASKSVRRIKAGKTS